MEYNNELYHHGILGMKWGIRRYQNKDGSLTTAGKKRRTQGGNGSAKDNKTSKAAAAKTSKSAASVLKRKINVSDMTDAEIRDHINRMNLEKQYYDTRKSLAVANPKKVSAGKKFMNGLVNDVVVPAAKESGRKWLTGFMENRLGLNKKSEMQRLEEKWKKLDYKKKISDLKKGIRDNEDTSLAELEKRWKTLDYEKKIRDLESPNSFDLDSALVYYRNLPDTDRQDITEAAKMYENIYKIRKKGKSDD